MNYHLDAQGLELKERHGAWWRREERLYTRATGTPLGDLWLPLADGSDRPAGYGSHAGYAGC